MCFFDSKKGGAILHGQMLRMVLRAIRKKHSVRRLVIAGFIIIVVLGVVAGSIINNIVGEAASMVGIQKMAEEKYKQTNAVPDIEVPRDLLQEYYLPASIEFGVSWSAIAGIHAVQTEFARSGGLKYSDAFDLPDTFWQQYKISKREYDWQKGAHTAEEIQDHIPFEPDRGRLDDLIWTVTKFLSSIDKWDNRSAVFPKVNEITEFNADTEKAMQFAWVYRFQFAASGILLSLEPSQIALGLIPPEYMEIYKLVEEKYKIPWNYIAAIHYVETRFGTYVNPITKKLMVSEAGALGHFQFMPATWAAYGLDKGGGKDPFDVIDSAFSCANYLIASGFHNDIDKAIFAYNRDWNYVSTIKTQAALFAEVGGPIAIGQYVLPVSNMNISSVFGPRWGRMHNGIDVAGPIGTPIYAFAAGTVTYAGQANGFGTLITIDHGNGVQTRYGHSKRLYVSAGQNVPAGYPIAAMGSEGRSSGSHLHFEVLVNGKFVDPMPYLNY